jgi:hypothetical protein
MPAQRAMYYFRVARKIVHAVQAQHLDALLLTVIAKKNRLLGVYLIFSRYLLALINYIK